MNRRSMNKVSFCLRNGLRTPHKLLISLIALALLLPVSAVGLMLWLAYGALIPEMLLIAAFALAVLMFWLFLLGVLRIEYHGRDLLQDFA